MCTACGLRHSAAMYQSEEDVVQRGCGTGMFRLDLIVAYAALWGDTCGYTGIRNNWLFENGLQHTVVIQYSIFYVLLPGRRSASAMGLEFEPGE